MATAKKRGRGRPAKPHRNVHFKLSAELEAWLTKASRKEQKSKTAIVEEALRLLQASRSAETGG